MANISKIKVGNTSYGITATPTAHASTATTYGAASASNYGHVKLSDNYTSSAGAAASGIGASSAAVYNAYNTLNSNLTLKTITGIGCSVYYDSQSVWIHYYLSGISLATGSENTGLLALPSNVLPRQDLLHTTCSLNSGWYPTSNNVLLTFKGVSTSITIRTNTTVSSAVVHGWVCFGRNLFAIT